MLKSYSSQSINELDIISLFTKRNYVGTDRYQYLVDQTKLSEFFEDFGLNEMVRGKMIKAFNNLADFCLLNMGDFCSVQDFSCLNTLIEKYRKSHKPIHTSIDKLYNHLKQS